MDYKKYLLTQETMNLQYIARKMWPTNKNAKSYLSTKLNDKGRPWTDADNKKAEVAIHELGLKLLKDAPNGAKQENQPVPPKPKETPAKQAKAPKKPVAKEVKEQGSKKAVEKEPTMAELLRQVKI